jgi:hypothetical protein
MTYRPRIRPGWYSYSVDGHRCWVRVIWVVPNPGATGPGDWWITYAAPLTTTHAGWLWEEQRVCDWTFRRGNPPREIKASLYGAPMWGEYRREQWEVTRERRRLRAS